MQISSTSAGFISGPGSSVALPTTRKPADGPSVNARVDVSSVTNARALQQIAPLVAPATTSINAATNADASRALVLARQYEALGDVSANVQTGRSGSEAAAQEAAAQRAVMEYNNVAMQEQRFALTGVLAGIDVFA